MMSLDLLLTDTNVTVTLWLQDPIRYMEQHPDADVLVSSDHLRGSRVDGGLEEPTEAGSALNIGIMFFRHSPGCLSLVTGWDALIQVRGGK